MRPVIVVEYDRSWPGVFEALAAVYRRALGPLALRIEHVGSTAVPGLAAKPVIDVDIVIGAAAQLPEAARLLAGIGYRHIGDLGIPTREAFLRCGDDVPRDGSGRAWPAHNLYVCPADSPELERHIRFRDWLRAHPEGAARYGLLKRELAERFRLDRDAYTEAKTDFVLAALGQTRSIPG